MGGGGRMRAVIYHSYGGPEQLRLAEVPMPVAGRGGVLVRVLACGVNLSDHEFLTGSPAYARFAGLFRPRRAILGSDIVGQVAGIGPGVSGLQIGQRVMADAVLQRGGFAEFAALPAALCALVPEGLSDVLAAALPQPGAIAVQGMAGAAPGMRVLINGAGGGSGTLALHLAKAAGARVTVVDRGEKLDWLLGLGADEAIDYRLQDFVALGRGWDLILDMVATRGARRVAAALAPGGTYRAVGGAVRVILPLALAGLMPRGRVGVMAVKTGAEVTLDLAARALAGRLVPQIHGVWPLDAVPEALRLVGSGGALGKIVIRP